MKYRLINIRALVAILVSILIVSCVQQASQSDSSADVPVKTNTLQIVKDRGELICGVAVDLPGFTSPDPTGRMTGLDTDICRAIAAAVLGDAEAVRFVSLNAKERFTALTTGEIDVLVRNTTWTLSRDASLGVNFVGINYYDGQGFLVRKSLGVDSAFDLDGASVCVGAGTTTELNLADFFRTNKMTYDAITYDNAVQVREGFAAGRCEVLTSDASGLAAIRSELADPDSAKILPDIISKEPLGPAVRQGDDRWFNVVKWVLFATINAEEYGITSYNVDDLRATSNNPNVRRLLGTEGETGKSLGLDPDWAYNIIKGVGNYGEIFAKNVGANSPLQLPRGVNELWIKGGLMYAPPVR